LWIIFLLLLLVLGCWGCNWKFFSCWVVEIRRGIIFTILKSSCRERERERASQLQDWKQRKPNFSKNRELWCAITFREMEFAREKCSCHCGDRVQDLLSN
jgi:hypothetical protein